MKQQIVLLCGLLFSMVVNAIPVPDNNSDQSELELVQIPLSENKELDILSIDESDGRLSERSKRTIGILRELFPEISKINADDNHIDISALNQRLEETIRVARQATSPPPPTISASDNSINSDETVFKTDQEAEESKQPPLDDLSLDSDENEADDRNKRFLLGGGSGGGGGLGGSSQSSNGGGSAGSGNFLFDIIRLFSGSASNQQQDEQNNSDSSSDENGKSGGGDGYTEGIPGPVTRLFVLANRGLSNLIQDLILRIAQTSERVVNFKAKLITSLI